MTADDVNKYNGKNIPQFCCCSFQDETKQYISFESPTQKRWEENCSLDVLSRFVFLWGVHCTWFLHMMCAKCKHTNTFRFSSFKNSFSMLCSFRYCVNFRWFISFFIITYYCVTIVVAQCYMKTIDHKIFMKFNLFLRCMHRNIPVVLMHWINFYVRAGSDSKFTSYMFCIHSIDIFGRKKACGITIIRLTFDNK